MCDFNRDNAFMRTAIRREGGLVNAYLARMETMDGAILLASISYPVCHVDPQAFEDFKALVSGFALRQVAAATGTTPRMVETVAPEGERAGHAG